ncbi:MAG TPA: ATP-binding protein [Polyangiaceae bacterium]|nr:ATP-binding protein [Polyangiaceae bacterium]
MTRRWLAVAVAVAALLSCVSAEASEDFRVVPAEPGTLVLVRPRANASDKEGVVIDSETLVQILKARVLQARGLDEVAELSSLGSYGRREASLVGGYRFAHEFGPPFESVSASLNLRPLADPEDGSLVVPLSIVLCFSLALGLIALYRMAAAQVRFAERRNNFVSAVSHELKTPLTAIRMHAEMLEEDLVDGDAKRHEYYRTITKESERLTRLIDNVLSLAQLERGTRRLSLVLGDVRPAVVEALEMLRPQVESQGFVLEFEAAPSLPSVRYDPDALKQVLFNLVENALKYGRDASERRITVRLEPRGNGVELSVRDRGPGVLREHMKSIFEPFFRAEHELTRKNQGTGIGLSLVQGLARAMEASVEGENAHPGFRVRLELRAEQG